MSFADELLSAWKYELNRAHEQIDLLSSGQLETQARTNGGAWRDTTAELLSYHRKMTGIYEKLIARHSELRE